jgi:hypothetical protein
LSPGFNSSTRLRGTLTHNFAARARRHVAAAYQ